MSQTNDLQKVLHAKKYALAVCGEQKVVDLLKTKGLSAVRAVKYAVALTAVGIETLATLKKKKKTRCGDSNLPPSSAPTCPRGPQAGSSHKG